MTTILFLIDTCNTLTRDCMTSIIFICGTGNYIVIFGIILASYLGIISQKRKIIRNVLLRRFRVIFGLNSTYSAFVLRWTYCRKKTHIKWTQSELSYICVLTCIDLASVSTTWVRARFCKLQKKYTRLAASSDKVYQLRAHGQWFFPGTSTTKTRSPWYSWNIAESGIKHKKFICFYDCFIRLRTCFLDHCLPFFLFCPLRYGFWLPLCISILFVYIRHII